MTPAILDIADTSSLPWIKHVGSAGENSLAVNRGDPDVTIDCDRVIRATGQAVIPYCVECRLRGMEDYCPISGLVIDPLEIYKPKNRLLPNRAHFPKNDKKYQAMIRNLLTDPRMQKERHIYFFDAGETWMPANGVKRPSNWKIHKASVSLPAGFSLTFRTIENEIKI